MKIEFLKKTIDEAKKSFIEDEIPVGAMIVKNDIVLSITHNTKEKNNCAIYHAEINAIIKACKKLKNWRLDDCDMYVSFEPCPMCASAIRQSRIRNVYCALSNLNKNNSDIINRIFSENDINPKVDYFTDLLVEDSKKLIQKFFENKRK